LKDEVFVLRTSEVRSVNCSVFDLLKVISHSAAATMNNGDEKAADDAVYRLEGTGGDQRGGLVIMKKGQQSADVERHKFKQPAARQSLLGLDKLAASKRLRAGEQDTVERVKDPRRER